MGRSAVVATAIIPGWIEQLGQVGRSAVVETAIIPV